MNRVIQFRVWTGKKMFYQEKQYLASFIRRAVVQIMLDHDMEEYRDHESYLPNGGNIDEYLLQFTGETDKNGKEIYEGDILGLDDPDDKSHAVIVFRNAAFHAELVGAPYIDDPHWTTVDSDWVVIGNRFEHPHLLVQEGGTQP